MTLKLWDSFSELHQAVESLKETMSIQAFMVRSKNLAHRPILVVLKNS
jgi:hypothetical protein